MDLLKEIRKLSREEWEQWGLDRWTDLRIWVQEHGEAAALAALVTGIFLVLFFKYFLAVLVLALIVWIAILYFAVSENSAGECGSSGRSLSGLDEAGTPERMVKPPLKPEEGGAKPSGE